jgi:hypothetical protein
VRGTVVVLLLAAVTAPAGAGEAESRAYFPLGVGNWWQYEELDDDGATLSRETWTVVARTPADRAGEFHLRSSTKRFDVLGQTGGRRWTGDEYLSRSDGGLRKRFPAGRDAETEVVLLKEPLAAGTRWHDAQGDCEVASRGACTGPRGTLPDCAVVVCRLGSPTATVVTSTYARGVGMVRQEIQVVQFLPAMHGGGAADLALRQREGRALDAPPHRLPRRALTRVSAGRCGSPRRRAAPRRPAAAPPG